MKTCNKTQKLTKQNDRINNFANTKRKKSVGTQSKKKHKSKHICRMNALRTTIVKHARKPAPAGLTGPEQTWPAATARLLQN